MAEKIKILIVDDNESTREGTQRLLEYEDNIEIVGFAENGLEAISRVEEYQPHVVLMDINMPVMNGIEATQRLQQEAPRTKVIVVSVQDDAHYLKQAFRAGAVDFVAKPITSAELAQAIERAYNSIQAEPTPPSMPAPSQAWPGVQYPAPSAPEGHIVGVLGFKGGVGKTTLAVNIGVGLVQAGKKAVVVDTNLYFGDVGVFLNTHGQHTIIDLAHMASDPEQLEPQAVQSVLISHESGVKLLAAPKSPRESEPISAESVVNLLEYLKREFDYVIVDTSTTLDEVLDASIQVSERLVVVTTPTMPALKDTKILLSLLDVDATEKDKVILVLNQVDKSSRITADQIANYLKRPVAAQIPTDPSAVEAVNQGMALVTLDQRRVSSIRPLLSVVQLVRDAFEKESEEAAEQEAPRKRWW
ncbi:MAG: response regulator [Anaerolineae bacterium]|nr:response regulator [Anaerolineae bacterium]